MTDSVRLNAVNERQLSALAECLAPQLRGGGVVYLVGDLGAGKTTFARALLRRLGAGDRIKSPTYTLIENYAVDGLAVYHLDLYRIAEPGELEWLGLADLTSEPFLLVVEWPERAGGALPAADLRVTLAHAGAARDVRFEATSERGRRWLRSANLEMAGSPCKLQ